MRGGAEISGGGTAAGHVPPDAVGSRGGVGGGKMEGVSLRRFLGPHLRRTRKIWEAIL